MSKVSERAAHAERLKNDDTFKDVWETVRESQVKVFLDSRTAQGEREEAHVIIRALAKIESEITSRIENGRFEEKKGQHRGSD